MSISKRFVPALIGAALLSGCGSKGLAATAINPATDATPAAAQDVVTLPANYQTGITYPSMPGTPSLTRPDVPAFAKTSTGASGDPVNLLVAASESELRGLLTQTGWVAADPITLKSTLKMIAKAIDGGSYPTAPMSDLYLFGRKQDMAMEKDQEGVRARDHLRVWQTPDQDSHGRPFWAIAATRDVAIKLGPGMTLPTHQIAPDIDAERQLVIADFLRTQSVAMRYAFQTLPSNFQGMNGGGDEYFTDGRTIVLELNL